MTKKDFISAIDNGQAKVLTLEAAKSLNGKHIAWMYFGYESNEDVVNEMIVGDILSELHYYKTQPCEGYSSRAEYLEFCKDAKRLAELKNRLILIDEGGKYVGIFCKPNNPLYDEPTFCCSDLDREVYYIEL